ncbi:MULTISPECIES: hypothetical protein [Pseudomonas]|nr:MULTISPECIES: hypothetical protein [Pseudomonas]KHL75336.1 hypothetical protein PpSQ1_05725 [Pseudomonas putida]MDH1572004.1 hypothetical protein [Pseudomonas sp. GD03746]QQE82197.1 hypothetical protein JET17_16275 [Pseudomonas putida]UTL79536.1 hypothetical protein NL778_16205 [Pseudomonas putida]HEK1688874.1 hypothetical protein [Pseudomonas putida]
MRKIPTRLVIALQTYDLVMECSKTMQTDSNRLMTALEHKMLLENFNISSTQVEEQLKYIVCGQSTSCELERLLGPYENCESRGDLRLLRWAFVYTEGGLGLSDPQVLTVAIDAKGCVTDFALV